jgi:TRAP-type C4-dicarboxylate transport system permease small subunit
VTQDRSPVSRFLSEVRLGTRPPEAGDLLDWPGDEPRNTTRIERMEEIAAMIFFTIMFVSILVGVFWRYVLNDPLIWTVNAAAVAFVWTVLIAAGLPNWADEHIQFDLLYRRMSPRWQRVSRMAGNLLLVVTFALLIPATWDYLVFIAPDSVTGLPLTFNWAFSVVLWFLASTVVHRGRLLVHDIRDIAHERADRAGHE